MKLIMTLLVRDEMDILVTNIEYHLSQGVDFFIVTDNLSVDKTPLILKKYEEKGILHIIEEKRDDYSQYQWVTRMATMAFEDYAADWVIHNDADEFWWVDQPVGHLKSLLRSLPPHIVALAVERYNFIPPIVEGGFFIETMTLREKVSYNSFGSPLPPKVCHRGMKNIEISQGNHSVSVGGVDLVTHRSTLIIFHFPLRSYHQFENKIIKGGAAYQRNTILAKEIGRTWRELYELYLSGKLFSFYRKQQLKDDNISVLIERGDLIKDKQLLNYIKKELSNRQLSYAE